MYLMSSTVSIRKLLTITRLPFEARMKLNISEPGQGYLQNQVLICSSVFTETSRCFMKMDLYVKQDKPMLPSHHTKHILLDPLKSPQAHYMKIFTFKVKRMTLHVIGHV